jgi:hypothetical protein
MHFPTSTYSQVGVAAAIVVYCRRLLPSTKWTPNSMASFLGCTQAMSLLLSSLFFLYSSSSLLYTRSPYCESYSFACTLSSPLLASPLLLSSIQHYILVAHSHLLVGLLYSSSIITHSYTKATSSRVDVTASLICVEYSTGKHTTLLVLSFTSL